MKIGRRSFIKTSGTAALTPIALMGAGNSWASIKGHSSESDMVSSRPFDYSLARKWAPNANATDLTTVFPQLPGVIPQTELLAIAEKHMTEWMEKTATSEKMQQRGMQHMPWGIMGCYQKDWETPHLLFSKNSKGNKVIDADGIEYIDFNLGDTPDMFGHGSLNPAVKSCADLLLKDGLSTMMGNEDQLVAAELLAEKFGLPYWMHALSASDANRFVLATARHHTGRPNIAIPNFTYHGTIDETQKFAPSPGVISRFHDLKIYNAEVDQGTKIFNWNDLESLEEILADRSVACIMMEPVMSNFGWAWPKPGWHQGVRELCDKYGTLVCYDETHTISQGPSGMVGHLGIKGDFWTCGKCISSGIPGAVYGMTEAVAKKLYHDQHEVGFFTGAGLGFLGNALCGNTMSIHALRVTLEEVLTKEVFAHIGKNMTVMASEMERVNKKYDAPFRIETMGNRICYHFIPDQCFDPLAGLIQVGFGGLFELSHAYAWNHGMLIMPYFNMMMITPQHTLEDTRKWVAVYDDIVRIAMGSSGK